MALTTVSGKELTKVGFGTWNIEKAGAQRAIDVMSEAIKRGINHFDTAEVYGGGEAEELLGEAVPSAKRKDIFIASKLWANHLSDDTVLSAVEGMLDRLNTTYLDLLYIHWPRGRWQDAIKAMDRAVDEKMVRYVGVSNFDIDQLKEAQELARHPIMANQIHYSIAAREDSPVELLDYCRHSGVTVVAYSPLIGALQEPLVQEMATKYDATPAQIALAWLVNQDGVITIPKAARMGHLLENIEAETIRLDSGDRRKLDMLA